MLMLTELLTLYNNCKIECKRYTLFSYLLSTYCESDTVLDIEMSMNFISNIKEVFKLQFRAIQYLLDFLLYLIFFINC